MTSERKRTANQANAARSTGPRSVAGKKKASQNARKHGLNLPIRLDSSWAPRVQELARAFSGAGASHAAPAYAAAEAQAHLERILALKLQTLQLGLSRAQANGMTDEEGLAQTHIESAPELLKLNEYERKARSRLKRALREL